MRFLVPEVVQTSSMDCGPASLRSLLLGHGIDVHYTSLRDALYTDVDGTSIDTIEDVAQQFGLDAEQVVVPVDHVGLPQAKVLPAIAVVLLPTGTTHFVVVWRRVGPWLQVMDPGRGRQWVWGPTFLATLYAHACDVPAADWREYAGSPEFLDPLRARLYEAGVTKPRATRLIRDAVQDPGWRGLATLDAATRAAAHLVESRVTSKAKAGAMVARLADVGVGREALPSAWWTVREVDGDPDQVTFTGAVLLAARGRRAVDETDTAPDYVRRIQRAGTPSPWPVVGRLLGGDGAALLGLSALGLGLGAALAVAEVALFRGLLSLSSMAPPARAMVVLGLVWLGGSALLVHLLSSGALRRVGRGMELRLRAELRVRMPRLEDRYFSSRLPSDLAERAHTLHRIRTGPELMGQTVSLGTRFGVIAAAIALLSPWTTPLLLLLALAAAVVPAAAHRAIRERDLKLRTLAGALSQSTYDALRGHAAIRTHRAEAALTSQHDAMLGEWSGAALSLTRWAAVLDGVQGGATMLLAALVVGVQLWVDHNPWTALLVAYWSLQLPRLGIAVATRVRAIPEVRHALLRVIEPLTMTLPAASEPIRQPLRPVGVALRWRGVGVSVGGVPLIRSVQLQISPGEQVAVVGRSGAGKSTLVGLLLGHHRTDSGQLLVDGATLDAAAWQELWETTAWIDPQVQLWSGSLLDNVRYGMPEEGRVGDALRKAGVLPFVDSLEQGLQTSLGEDGGRLSGGEGQRVRIARALARKHVRLVVLDEPFRGLDGPQRTRLIGEVRQAFPGATMLCVTHDVEQAAEFSRVVVMEDGTVVEDEAPQVLLQQPESRFSRLTAAARAARTQVWGSDWIRMELEGGRIRSQAVRPVVVERGQ